MNEDSVGRRTTFDKGLQVGAVGKGAKARNDLHEKHLADLAVAKRSVVVLFIVHSWLAGSSLCVVVACG